MPDARLICSLLLHGVYREVVVAVARGPHIDTVCATSDIAHDSVETI